MDRAALDKLYNNRAAVPTHPEDMRRWEAASLEARRRLPVRLDLAYGAHPRERLDLFTVAAPGRPLVVFIHGGYWQALDKGSFSFIADGIAAPAAGQIGNLAVLNYPLAPEAGMDEIVASVRRALLWLWRGASRRGYSPDRIYVAGHSAGGHLTAMLALTDWQALDDAAPRDLVKGGVSISGLYDLEPVRRTYLNERLGMDETVAKRNSPLLLLEGWTGDLMPLACQVGALETEAFHGQQHDFVKIYAARGGPVTAVTASGKHHFNIVDELAKPGSSLHSELVAMLH